MVMVQKHGQMAPNMKDNTFKEKNMERVDLRGQMEVRITDNLWKIISKVKESIIGQTEENMMAHG